ncbi:hypothetical protein FRC08_002563 [Ceratobasidium sp. 394]|nr:hypothetical protein FRC08_002563 [Ceratobasidium sp. 394]
MSDGTPEPKLPTGSVELLQAIVTKLGEIEKANAQRAVEKQEQEAHQEHVDDSRLVIVLATFFATVQAQCLALPAVSGNDNDRMVRVINGLLLLGLLMSTYVVAATAISGAFSRKHSSDIAPTGAGDETHTSETRRRRSSDSGFAATTPIVTTMFGCSLYTFFIAMILYTWKFQPRATAITCTAIICCAYLAPLLYTAWFDEDNVLPETLSRVFNRLRGRRESVDSQTRDGNEGKDQVSSGLPVLISNPNPPNTTISAFDHEAQAGIPHTG